MMSEAVRIQTPEDLASFLARIRGESLLAVDTEAASFHRYHDRVYLLQLSTRTLSAIIDPLAVTDLSPLGRVLENPNLEVIFHDADYDLRLLDRQYQFRMHHIFDTRIAAQFLNEPGIGLAALLQKHFQVQLDKQYQRADWSIRPLSAEMIDYAVADTQYLPALRDILREQLILQSRLGWVEEECALVTGVRSGPSPDRMDAFLNVKGARGLDPRGLAVLREVYRWRETSAAAIDRASFRILGNEALIALAERRPASILEMEQIRGVGRELIARRAGSCSRRSFEANLWRRRTSPGSNADRAPCQTSPTRTDWIGSRCFATNWRSHWIWHRGFCVRMELWKPWPEPIRNPQERWVPSRSSGVGRSKCSVKTSYEPRGGSIPHERLHPRVHALRSPVRFPNEFDVR